MTITKMVALSVTFIMASPKGNHASGETGLRIWMTGFRMFRVIRLEPIRKPTGMAMSVPSPNPINTLSKDASN
jgi:hypothetical protein